MPKTIIILIALTAFILGAVGGGWSVSFFYGRMTDNLISGSQAAQAITTVRTLERLRDENASEAIELLEIHLDSALIGLGATLARIPEQRWDPAHLEVIQIAKDYRAAYPRTDDSPTIAEGVERTFRLLDNESLD
jgi:hypothetical protein